MMKMQRFWKNPTSSECRKGQSGIALITVVIVFSILILVVGVSIVLARTETSTSTNNIRAEQALSLAEAGIDWGAAKLRDNPSFSTTTTYLSISGNPVGVTVTTNPQTKSATVVAYSTIAPAGTEYPTATRAIRATFLVDPGIIPGGSLFERAITTNGKITTKNNAAIHVSSVLPNFDGIAVLSNYAGADAVTVGQNFSIDGTVGLMAGATSSGLSAGQITQPAAPDPVPTLTPTQIEAWRQLAKDQIPPHYYLGNQDWGSGVTLDGVYFVDGNVVIDNKLSGNGTLVVNGSLTTKNKTEWTSTSMALLVTGGASLDTKNSASITGYIYVDGNIEFKNNMTLVGAITATGDVYFGKNNATITFQNLGEGGTYNPPGFSTSNQSLQLQSWQEVAP